MQKITPFLWFDSAAEEAAGFYASLFPDSAVGKVARYGEEGKEIHGRPPGSVMTVEFRIAGHDFVALNGGPIFTFTPATSLFVRCDSIEEIDRLWAKLSEGGKTLMELQKYPFSEKYGWLNDRFGLSWQLFVGPAEQKITPQLMFTRSQAGKAEEAMRFYASILPDSRIDQIARYGAGMGEPETSVVHADFTLSGVRFKAMDSSGPHAFGFTEAFSFVVSTADQAETDKYWDLLGEGGDPAARQCGWLKDKYGVSWQIVPGALDRMLQDPDKARAGRVMTAMLQMKKLDIEGLQRAYEGR